MHDKDTVVGWRGHELVDREGDKIGKVADVYLDRQNDRPEWVTVRTGLFGRHETFVPIREATAEGEMVRVPFDKAHVKEAPNVDPESALSGDEEAELYRHYGIDYSGAPADSGSATEGDRGQEPAPGQPSPGQEQPQPSGGETPQEGAPRQAAPGEEQPQTSGEEQPQTSGEEQPQTSGEETAHDDAPSQPSRGEEHLQEPEAGQAGEGEDRRAAGSTGSSGESSGEAGEAGQDAERRADVSDQPDPDSAASSEQGRASARSEAGLMVDRVAEEPAGEGGAKPVEPSLRLKKYVVREEVRIPVEREETRIERD